MGECSYDTENGLQLHASNNCHLCQINWNAPRILRPIDEDIAVEPVCNPFGDDRPYAGGVVIWKDESNYLYVVRGEFGKNDIAFMGCIGGREALIGRGRLICHGPVIVATRAPGATGPSQILPKLRLTFNARTRLDGTRFLDTVENSMRAETTLRLSLRCLGCGSGANKLL